MAIAGLVLGILAAVGGFVPGLSYVAWLLAVIGIILSAIALRNGYEPRGLAIAGLVLSIVGLVVALAGLICLIAFAGALASAGSMFL